jgi:hypothetical protein
MAAVLVDYTSYAEVRAVLGVSEDEISDATLALPIYAESVQIELEEVGAEIPADFAAVVAIDEGTRTDAQNKFYAAVGLFAAYAVAVQLGSSLPLFAPKSITDGKAGFARDSSSPYKEALKAAKASYERFRGLLDSRYAAYKNASVGVVVLPFLSVVSPSTDPVAG